MPNKTARNGSAAFTSVMVKVSGWHENTTPLDARIRILENIDNLEKSKFVEEKTAADIKRERLNHLVKTRNEEALKAMREWEEQRGGPSSKRAQPAVNDQDHESDLVDMDDKQETGSEIADDSMVIDDNSHDQVQAQQIPDDAGTDAGSEDE
jgi:hypothetical protein